MPDAQAQSLGPQSTSWSTFSVQNGDSKKTYTVDHTESSDSTIHNSSNGKNKASANAANSSEMDNKVANMDDSYDIGNLDYTGFDTDKPPPPPASPPKGINYDPRKSNKKRFIPQRPSESSAITNAKNHKNYHNHRLIPEQPPQKLLAPKKDQGDRR